MAPRNDILYTVENWDKLDEDTRWWVGGILDGDGMVRYQHTLHVEVGQAENGHAMIERLRDLFGGFFVPRVYQSEKHQPLNTWFLLGPPAISFAAKVAPYTVLKRPQFEMAGRIDPRCYSKMHVAAVNRITGEAKKFDSRADCCRHFGISAQNFDTKMKGTSKRRDALAVMPDWTLTTWKDDPMEGKARRKREMEALSEAKKVPHAAITQELPLSYVAGFIDADGSICIGNISASQKYPAVTDYLARTFGGSSTYRETADFDEYGIRSGHLWTLSGARAVDLIAALEPFLWNKKPQAHGALSAAGARGADLEAAKAALSALKGRQLLKPENRKPRPECPAWADTWMRENGQAILDKMRAGVA